MLRRVIFVVVVCACVGVAYGGANKIRWFTACEAQVDESEDTLGADADPDGMAILNYASGAGKTIVQIIVSDMTPNQTYNLRLMNGAPEEDVVVLSAFTTNEEGHGTFHQEFLDTEISEYHVELFVGTTTTGEVWSQQIDRDIPPLPPDPDPLGNTSSVHPESFEGSRAADNINLVPGQVITSIRWWGGTCNAAPPIETFRVRFYNDDGAKPGTVLYEQNVTPMREFVGPFPACAQARDEFEFLAELPDEFVATEPETATYWVEVVGYWRADNATFNWSNTRSGDGSGRQKNPPGTGEWFPQPDRAFELFGETDTTALRAVGANPEATSDPPDCPPE